MSRIALVTGSSGGLGMAICQALADAGMTVLGADLAPSGKAGVTEFPCDLRDLAQIDRLVSEIESTHGPVAVLVNNAGLFHGTGFLEASPEQFDAVFDVNIRSVYFLTQRVCRKLVQSQATGCILNIASIAGRLGSVAVDYAASKAGVIALTRSLGKSLAQHGIRVNTIAPGLIETPMGDLVPREYFARAVASIPI